MPEPTSDPQQNPYSEPPRSSATTAASWRRLAAPAEAVAALRQARIWQYVLSGIGFFMAGFILLALVGTLAFLNISAGARGFRGNIWPFLGLILVYGVGVGGLVIPSVLLWNSANRIGRLVRYRRNEQLEAVLVTQRTFWRWTSVLGVVVLLLWAAMWLIQAVPPR